MQTEFIEVGSKASTVPLNYHIIYLFLLLFGLVLDAPPSSMAISSSELNLLDSLTISPDPLGGRLEILVLVNDFSEPLDDAGPGLVLSPGGI